MKRWTAPFIAAFFLASCGGTITLIQANRNWMSQSNFAHAHQALIGDARTSEQVLLDRTSSSAVLHTVCGVLLVDTEAANSSLPTPDAQSTELLGRAYNAFGGGANTCYRAGSDITQRARALKYLHQALADLSFASIRLSIASGR